MTTIAEIMTTEVRSIGPEDSLQRAAQLMASLDVGSLPVCNGKRLLGIVTDRDITVRGTAAGLAPAEAAVSDVMTREIRWCRGEQDVDQVMREMGDSQIRRVPVLDDEMELVGIVSLGDLATRQSGHIDETVRDISSDLPVQR